MVTSDNLDEMFRTLQDTEPYIADEGFSAAVMARLPETRQLPTWLTNLIMLAFTTLGSALAAWQLPLGQWSSNVKQAILQMPAIEIPAINPIPLFGLAALLSFGICYIVVWLVQSDTI